MFDQCIFIFISVEVIFHKNASIYRFSGGAGAVTFFFKKSSRCDDSIGEKMLCLEN